ARAQSAYEIISGQRKDPFLAVVITYPERINQNQRIELVATNTRPLIPLATPKSVCIGILGAGVFAQGTLLPAIKNANGTDLIGVCTATGARSRHAARSEERRVGKECSAEEGRDKDRRAE